VDMSVALASTHFIKAPQYTAGGKPVRLQRAPRSTEPYNSLEFHATARLKRRTKTHKDTDNFLCHGRR
jgi:hypothetical protein